MMKLQFRYGIHWAPDHVYEYSFRNLSISGSIGSRLARTDHRAHTGLKVSPFGLHPHLAIVQPVHASPYARSHLHLDKQGNKCSVLVYHYSPASVPPPASLDHVGPSRLMSNGKVGPEIESKTSSTSPVSEARSGILSGKIAGRAVPKILGVTPDLYPPSASMTSSIHAALLGKTTLAVVCVRFFLGFYIALQAPAVESRMTPPQWPRRPAALDGCHGPLCLQIVQDVVKEVGGG